MNKEQILSLIAQNRIGEAIEQLDFLLRQNPDKDVQDRFASISNQFLTWVRSENSGDLASEASARLQNQIANSIIELLNDATTKQPAMNLTEFADQYLEDEKSGGTRGLYDPYSFLDGSRTAGQLYDLIRNEGRTESTLATLFWQVLISSPWFENLLYRNGASKLALQENNFAVVPHGKNAYSLFVFDPFYQKEKPTVIRIQESLKTEIEKVLRFWKRHKQDWVYQKNRNGYFSKIAHYSKMIESLDENYILNLLSRKEIKILLLKSPGSMPQSGGACIPAMAVAPSPSHSPSSTAGVWARNAKGKTGVTICHHTFKGLPFGPVEGQTQVLIGEKQGIISSVDIISDSCFVETDWLPDDIMTIGLKGPLEGVSPRQNEKVKFCGNKSGPNPKETQVKGWSPDLLMGVPESQVKLFTDAVTNPGDSGAALVDFNDNVLGFAFYRTKLGENPSFTYWIWADSVFDFHGLSPI